MEENPIQTYTSRIDLSQLHQSIQLLKNEIGKVIIGQLTTIDLLIVGMLSNGHLLIEGPPGVAKTMTAKLLAKCIDAQFSRIQFTPDLMPSDVTGTAVFNQKTSEFEFKKGPLFAHIVLIDEINRAPAKTQAALFEAMQEHQVTADGNTYILEQPFMVLATQNPIEQEGTYRLPEAQLDRFIFKIDVSYPNLDEETHLLKNFHQYEGVLPEANVQKVLSREAILQYRQLLQKVVVEDHLLQYIARIIQETRVHKSLFLGASPRASLAILTASKAHAAVQGRDFVTPDDVKFIAPHVLNHRVILSPEKEMEGGNVYKVIASIIESVEVPR